MKNPFYISYADIISQLIYNQLGQLKIKKTGGTQNGSDRWQEVDYKYNIRGWLTNINDVGLVLYGKDAEPPTMGDDLFAFKINYNVLNDGGSQYAEPLYNGNITQTIWRTGDDNVKRGYVYNYDELNRLLEAQFYKSDNNPFTGAYTENLAYDLNGNITSLFRTTGDVNGASVGMDDLAYSYRDGNGNSNRLLNVSDAVSNQNTGGFIDGNTNPALDDYEYDLNGNMVKDRNKGITSITYNHLNLPERIEWSANKFITYQYNAAGQKVKKFVENNGNYEIIDYLDASTQLSTGSFQYAGEVLQYFPTTEGYVAVTPLLNNTTPVAYRFNYVYNYTDHLGNIRVSYTKNPQNGKLKILDENHYYPFGLKHERYLPLEKWKFIIDQQDLEKTKLKVALTDEYKYKYNGKEWQDELGLNIYDFEARGYDPAFIRTLTMDPLAETFHSQSPYSFFNNNPIRYADPTGMKGEDFIDVDKFSGKITVAEAPGDDKMRLIGEGGKVEKIETYGENGSFNRDSNITTNDIFASNGEYLRTEQIIESKNPDKLFKLFEFASNANTVEYGFLRTQDVWKSNGYLYSSGLTGSLGDRFQGFFDNLMKSSLSLNVTELWHNHPIDGGGTHMRSFKPSGFDDDGSISETTRGDRGFLERIKSNYINRVPQSANILLPNTNLMIRYNETSFKLFNR